MHTENVPTFIEVWAQKLRHMAIFGFDFSLACVVLFPRYPTISLYHSAGQWHYYSNGGTRRWIELWDRKRWIIRITRQSYISKSFRPHVVHIDKQNIHIIGVKPFCCHTWLVRQAHVWTTCVLVESGDKMTKICHIFKI